MNLIRDGGFARGDTKFWEHTGSGTFSIDGSEAKYGTYCGKMVVPAVEYGFLRAKDYIDIKFGQVLYLNYHIKAELQTYYATVFYEYDGDLNLINTTIIERGYVTTSYLYVEDVLLVLPASEYVRVAVRITDEEAETTAYIDSFMCIIMETGDAYACNRELCDLKLLTSSGDTSGTPIRLVGFAEYYAVIDCTRVDGTTPTLDVDIIELDVYDNERVLGSFTQLSAVGDERISLLSPTGGDIYVKYTEGGTWTQCEFKVSLAGVHI